MSLYDDFLKNKKESVITYPEDHPYNLFWSVCWKGASAEDIYKEFAEAYEKLKSDATLNPFKEERYWTQYATEHYTDSVNSFRVNEKTSSDIYYWYGGFQHRDDLKDWYWCKSKEKIGMSGLRVSDLALNTSSLNLKGRCLFTKEQINNILPELNLLAKIDGFEENIFKVSEITFIRYNAEHKVRFLTSTVSYNEIKKYKMYYIYSQVNV